MGPSQRPLPDNTQHYQQTDIHVPAGIEPAIPARERPQTHTLDRAATKLSKQQEINTRHFRTTLPVCLTLPSVTVLFSRNNFISTGLKIKKIRRLLLRDTAGTTGTAGTAGTTAKFYN